MSDFTQATLTPSPALAEYEARLLKATQETEKARALLAALPSGAPAPVKVLLFGYCADYGIELPRPSSTEEFQRLLAAYPPVPLVDLPTVRAQKPTTHLRGTLEQTAEQEPIHPVLFRASQEGRLPGAKQPTYKFSSRWWTQSKLGLVEVAVPDATPELLGLNTRAWHPETHSYATGHQTMHKRTLKDFSKTCSAFSDWDAGWAAFSAKLRSPGARSLVNSAAAMVRVGTEAQFETRCAARIAQYLNEAEKAELLAMFAPQKELLTKALAGQQDRLNRAVEWLTNLLAKVSKGPSTSLAWAALGQQLVKAAQAKAHLNFLKTEHGRHTFMVTVDGPGTHDGLFKEVTLPADPRLPALLLEMLNPEYEEE